MKYLKTHYHRRHTKRLTIFLLKIPSPIEITVRFMSAQNCFEFSYSLRVSVPPYHLQVKYRLYIQTIIDKYFRVLLKINIEINIYIKIIR
jgi:hypothetical protein